MKIDHVGIVVRDIDEALKVYEQALALPLKDVVEVGDQQVKVAFLPVGETGHLLWRLHINHTAHICPARANKHTDTGILVDV